MSSKKLPKIPEIISKFNENSLESVTRAISPISNNGEHWANCEKQPAGFKSVTRVISPITNNGEHWTKSEKIPASYKSVTRKISPLERFESQYEYEAHALDRGSLNSGVCKNCKRLKIEVENWKRSLKLYQEKSELNEKHLKQYESLLNIKENRLKERENLLNEQISGLESEKIRLDRENLKKNKEKGLAEGREEKIKGKTEQVKNGKKDSDKKKFCDQITETEKFYNEKKIEKILAEIQNKEKILMQTEAELKIRVDSLELSQKKCLETEAETKKILSDIEKIKKLLEIKEKTLSEKIQTLESCNSCINLKKTLKIQQENFETQLQKALTTQKQTFESELKASLDTQEAHHKISLEKALSTQKQNFESELKISLETQQEHYEAELKTLREHSGQSDFYTSPQDSHLKFVETELSDTNYKTPEIGLEKIENYDSPQMKTLTDSYKIDLKDLGKEEVEFKNGSRDESVQLSIVARLKAKLQQKSFEAEQLVKLKEILYQQENQKYVQKIEQCEKCNESLYKEIQEMREKLKQTLNEKEKLSETVEEHLETISVLNTKTQNLSQKIEELVDDNRKLEDLNEKLKSKILIYKTKRGNQDDPVEYEELENLTQELEAKLLILQHKQSEIDNIKRLLLIEQQNILNNTDCLKILFQDFNVEKSDFLSEKEDFISQKSALLEIERAQQERITLLEVKENELMKFKDELIERERLHSQYYQIPNRFLRRMSTQLGKFIETPTSASFE